MKDNEGIREVKHLARNILSELVPAASLSIEVNYTEILINLLKSLYKSIQSKITLDFQLKFQKLNGIIVRNFHYNKNAVVWIEAFGEEMQKHAPKKSKKRRRPVVTGDHQQRLDNKISELRNILDTCSVTSATSNESYKMMIEMLVLDIMSDMVDSDCLAGDFFFLDDDVPFLVSKYLRNYLAHGNPVAALLCPETWAATLANAKFLTQNPIDKKLIIIRENEKTISTPEIGLYVIKKHVEMVRALKCGDSELLKKCLDEGADLKSRNVSFSTVWHHAACGSSLETLRMILNENDAICERDAMERTPLHVAAAFGQTEFIHFITDKASADISCVDIFGKTPLHLAAENGHEEAVNALLTLGAQIAVEDMRGELPIYPAVRNNHEKVVRVLLQGDSRKNGDRNISLNNCLSLAVKHGHVEILKYLLFNNADVNAKSLEGRRPLHLGSNNASGEVVRTILEKGSFVNVRIPRTGDTALHISAENAREDTARVLLLHGAAVNVQNKKGFTPLHRASIKGHKSLVNILVEHGADVDALDNNNSTPIMYAARGGHTDIVKFLVDMGASLEIVDKDKLTALHFSAMAGCPEAARILINKAKVIDRRDYEDRTPLHLAALNDKMGVVELLVAAGANVMATGKNGETALHLCARTGQTAVLEYLIKMKADPNSIDLNGVTPLTLASHFGHHRAVQELIKGGAYVDQYEKYNKLPADTDRISSVHSSKQDNYSMDTPLRENLIKTIKTLNAETLNEDKLTALHVAAECGHLEIVEELLKRGAVVDISDQLTNKPIHLASRNGHAEVVEAVLRAQGSVDSLGRSSWTALHNAARRGHASVVRLLIQAGARVDAQMDGGKTALHLAAMGNHKEVITLLLDNNLDVNIVDDSGISALTVAVRFNYKDIVHILLAKGADVNVNKGNPLMVAIFAGQKSITKILLNRKDINLTVNDNTSISFLHVAVLAGNWSAGRFLLKKGVHVDTPGERLRTPLHAAVMGGLKEFVQLLLEYNANVNAVDEDNLSSLDFAVMSSNLEIIEILLRHGVTYSAGVNGITPVEMAIRIGKLDVVQVLLKHFTDEINKESALNIAVVVGNLDAVKLMVKNGADYTIRDEIGATSIQKAACGGFSQIVEYFLDCGVKPDITDETGRTLLHYAVWKGHNIHYLTERGLDVNTADQYNQLPLHNACNEGNLDAVRVLLQYGSNYCTIDKSGKTPMQCAVSNQNILDQLVNVVQLSVAVSENDVEKIKSLVSSGVPVNARGLGNWTPLLYSAWKGNEEVCRILLEAGANPDYTGKGGNSPIHLAAFFSHFEIVKSLLANGAIYNILNWKKKTPSDLAVLKEIKDILAAVDEAFIKVHNGDTEIIKELKKMKDDGVIKAIIRARCQEGKSLVVVAMENNFSKVDELKNILQGNGLAMALDKMEQRDYTGAMNHLDVVLDDRKRILGEDNPGTLDIMALQAKIYSKQQNYFQALELLEFIDKKETHMFGALSKYYISTKISIAEVLMKQGNHRRAHDMLQEIYYQHLRRDIHAEMKTGCLYAETLCSLGKYPNAGLVSNETYQFCIRELGEKHPSTRYALLTTANVLAKQTKDSEALAIYRKVYETWNGELGSNSSHTHQSLRHMSEIVLKAGKQEEALSLFRELLALQRNALGATHADTLITKKQVSELIQFQNEEYDELKKYTKHMDETANELELDHPYISYLNRKKTINNVIDLEPKVQDFDREMIDSARDGRTARVEELAKLGHDVNTADEDWRTPLYHAASGDHASTVAVLLSNGADIEDITADGDNALHAAAASNDVLQLLIQNISHYTDFINIRRLLDGATALHIAVVNGAVDAVKILVDNGARWDVPDKAGRTPRDLASPMLLAMLDKAFEGA